MAKLSLIRSEFKKQTTTALIAAFGLVIALSWQTVIKKIVDSIPKTGILLYHPYLADLYTAIIITFIGAIAILMISFWANRPTKAERKIANKEAIKEQRLSSTKLEDQGLVYVVDLLRKGKIVAWFQGGSEIGPRALCHRSILADARDPEMKNKLNKIKLREEFRPVAPVVLKEEAISWFEIEEDKDYPFMLFSVKCNKSEDVPSALHIDESARIQTVSIEDNKLIWALLQIWDKATAVPMLINTSFNDSGMPIVESPSDALKCFASTEIDALFFVDHSLIVEK